MRTLLNDLYAHIGYDDYGYLVHTDKKSGKQKMSRERWADVQTAKKLFSRTAYKIEGGEFGRKQPPARGEE